MPVEVTKRYKRVRIEAPGHFDRRSFRVVTVGTHKVIVGCPKGAFGGRRCKAGTRVQAVLHPLTEGNPCGQCDRVKLGFLW